MSPARKAPVDPTPNDPTRGDPTPDEPIPVAELGYEQARDELIDVVATLERGGLDLDASLALWERGEALAARCEQHLDGARARIEAVLADGDNPTSDNPTGDDDLTDTDDLD